MKDNAVHHAQQMRQRINASWLVRLRWGAVIGQLAAVLATQALWNVDIPVAWILAVLGVTVTTNVALMRHVRGEGQITEPILVLPISLDLLLLTALLYLSGGSTNPFNFLYLVHMALAAVILRGRSMVLLLFLSCASFAALFRWHRPLLVTGAPALPEALRNGGTIVAFALAAVFIVYFVHRVTTALSRKDTELAHARDISARNERLTSLATLAAGAAHELSTPLATIAVAAQELERRLRAPSHHDDESLLEDAQLIRQEVQRCRKVLQQMAVDAGTSCGEPLVYVATSSLLQQALEELPHRHRVEVNSSQEAEGSRLRVPERSIVQAVRAVIKNALEASEQGVRVRLATEGRRCSISVHDGGIGMAPDILAHVSEPFFTTKEPGVGMGLGLFLTRTVLERLGGSFELRSCPQDGTTAVLWLPLAESETP